MGGFIFIGEVCPRHISRPKHLFQLISPPPQTPPHTPQKHTKSYQYIRCASGLQNDSVLPKFPTLKEGANRANKKKLYFFLNLILQDFLNHWIEHLKKSVGQVFTFKNILFGTKIWKLFSVDIKLKEFLCRKKLLKKCVHCFGTKTFSHKQPNF